MAEKKMTDWHRKVLCNFDNAWSATQDMRKQIIEAQRFVRVSGAQWEGSTNAGYSFDEGRFEHYQHKRVQSLFSGVIWQQMH